MQASSSAWAYCEKKGFDDCRHIAAAIVSGCDVIVSWNFKHIVNHKTMMGVKAVTALEGFNDVLIYDPSNVLSIKLFLNPIVYV